MNAWAKARCSAHCLLTCVQRVADEASHLLQSTQRDSLKGQRLMISNEVKG